MVKIMKPNKVVLVLNGKYAGRKAIVLRNQDEGTTDRSYGHALVAGIDRYPRPIIRRMGKKKREKRCKIKPFLKIYNYNHLMPTRYRVDINIDKKVLAKDVTKDAVKRRNARREVKAKFEEKYKTGSSKWFFSKLRF
ncbi:60S ribosomal protein L27-like protein [Dinothrombium tinctorium]|uniref:Large ribosomal subunit protein eL27 n=1 Tax=Dinothrombium tinctorium TaxID=1965070 RepID=A0A3S3PMX0_9ACAR|nr:60S ribosomal protein L27-like protein [Dinothrombium tinctorium]RWS04727.1 60S ribosomal protein L27-like protein [Dinothrombium tinctorium]